MTDPAALLAFIRGELEASAAVLRALEGSAPAIQAAGQLIATSLEAGGKLLLCGNGGSAADCQHLAAELVNLLDRHHPRPALAAMALTTDTSLLTAIANDVGFEQVFERQVEGLGRTGDVLLAISTSGNSPNILRAMERSRKLGLRTVLLTGEEGGRARVLADVAVLVPSHETRRIQEAHAAVGHLLCALVERSLAGR